jgi:hypothetical protein
MAGGTYRRVHTGGYTGVYIQEGTQEGTYRRVHTGRVCSGCKSWREDRGMRRRGGVQPGLVEERLAERPWVCVFVRVFVRGSTHTHTHTHTQHDHALAHTRIG